MPRPRRHRSPSRQPADSRHSKAGCATTARAAQSRAWTTRHSRNWRSPRANASSTRRCGGTARSAPVACTGSVRSRSAMSRSGSASRARTARKPSPPAARSLTQIKHRLPIWKREHYADGSRHWVNCERCAAPAAVFDYSRQTALPEIGEAGQRRLAEASVVVVGAGGLGSAALVGLAGAGIGTIHIVDDDVVEASNLHRQPLFAQADVGQPKAQAAARRLTAYNPSIRVLPHALPLRCCECR